jgi:hypothetical protein
VLVDILARLFRAFTELHEPEKRDTRVFTDEARRLGSHQLRCLSKDLAMRRKRLRRQKRVLEQNAKALLTAGVWPVSIGAYVGSSVSKQSA